MQSPKYKKLLQLQSGGFGKIFSCISPKLGNKHLAQKLMRGDLFELINKVCPIPERHARIIFCQVLKGLLHLHQNGIIHRDIKPENVLFDDEFHLHTRLIDYGHSCFLSKGKASGYFGTKHYTAPEVLQCKNNSTKSYTTKADLYSMGVLLYTMVKAQIIDFDLLNNLNPDYGFNPNDEYFKSHPNIREILCGLLARDPKKRWTIEQLINHRWISSSHIDNHEIYPDAIEILFETHEALGFHDSILCKSDDSISMSSWIK